MPLPLNKEFGPYLLTELIAIGGMAEVYLAKTRGMAGFEKFLALKVIHPDYADDDAFIDMLIDEAKIAVELTHANIVQTFDLGRHADNYFISMEYVDGIDLFQFMRRFSDNEIVVPVDVAAYIGQEVCAGLDYAHRRRDIHGRPLNIVHRDISPQNVLLSRAGEVKVVDFGIAKAASRSAHTQAGVIKGKHCYMSPEQAQGDALDLRTDIFSAGVVLYEVAAGQMAYREEDLDRLLPLVRQAIIAPLATVRPDVPPVFARILGKALHQDRTQRYASAAEFQTALTGFLSANAPDFTPQRLAVLVERALALPARQVVAKAAPRQHTRRVGMGELLLSKSEFRAVPTNSVLYETTAPQIGLPVTDQDPSDAGSPSSEEDPGETTVIAASPFAAVDDEPTIRGKREQILPQLPKRAAVPALPPQFRPPPIPQPPVDDILNETTMAESAFAVGQQVPPPSVAPPPPIIAPPVMTPPPAVQSRATPAPMFTPTVDRPALAHPDLLPMTPSEPAKVTRWIWPMLAAVLVGVLAAVLIARKNKGTEAIMMEVISVPAGAQVRINGQSQGQTTPLTITVADPSKSQRVEVALPGYETWASDISFSGGHRRVRALAVLNELTATLTIESEPTGADVYLNNEHKGRTPIKLDALLLSKTYQVELRKKGYTPVLKPVVWNGRREVIERIKLLRY